MHFPTTHFQKLVLIDRSVDPLSCLATPTTYEALLRELCQANGTHFLTMANYDFVGPVCKSVFNEQNQNIVATQI